MKTTKLVLSKIAHGKRLRSFRTCAALIVTTLMLMVAVATPVATAQTYTDLFDFWANHGRNPMGFLAQGRDGNLYGTTYSGGKNGEGIVFRITPSGTEKVLYNFDGVHGGIPVGGLTLGTDGNFYGTTNWGGVDHLGTIFKITKSGNLTTLYSFTGGSGVYPCGAPIQGSDGSFYGTTSNGYACGGYNSGTTATYKITPSGTFTLLASFQDGSDAPLFQATDGNFYGTTTGKVCGGCVGGTVFKMTPKGVVTIVYNFDGIHGSTPMAPVIQGTDGNFYGTTPLGGSEGGGVVFKLTPRGTLKLVHNFGDPAFPNDGYYPVGGLLQATDGNFYGTTTSGGTTNNGVIFQITPAGAYSILYNFDGTHGRSPVCPMQHTNGKTYGLTFLGGTHDEGVVYSFDLGLVPFVSLVSTMGKVGKTIEVLGQGFTGTTAVALNGTAATFKIVSDTYLKATVPSGATTGFVTVTTPSGTLTSNKPFTVKP